MRQLSQPATLLPALAAAALTTLTCLPRFARWQERTETISFLLVMAGFTSFVGWAFVFAWSPTQARRWPLPPRDTHGWTVAIAGGVLIGSILAFTIDPTLRQITPHDYPDSPSAWLAGTLFTLGFVQLFLCFAPFAFFYRLFHSIRAGVIGTLAFGVLVLSLQLQQTPASPGPAFSLVLYSFRLCSSGLALYLLLRGGPWLVWLTVLLAQARLLPSLLAS